MCVSHISEIDSNFQVISDIKKEDILFYDIDQTPFQIYGIFKENEKYRRMPETIARNISDGVCALHTNTAGGRVRFITDSSYIAIQTKMTNLGAMPHFAYTGSMGFDLYVNNQFEKTFVPPLEMDNGYESIIEFDTNECRDITIYFPLYSDVEKVYIGIQRQALLEKASDYILTKPIVYYGSSITQGGCASRPGMCYPSILSRIYHCDFVNLGFSGNAKAEDAMIQYIENLDMSLFVYDYDHNAPTLEHLSNTHEKMFQAIRKKHKNIPIIMMSRPKHKLTTEESTRLAIIRTTYQNAILSGDKNVYLVDGAMLTALCGQEGTVDGCHPTDFGFVSMAKVLEKVIEDNLLLKKNERRNDI